MAMTVDDLQTWLDARSNQIFGMMDYEPSIYPEDRLANTLDAWFGTPNWREHGHRFLHLGIDGTGSQVAAWLRPGTSPDAATPVVLFGSEGDRAVLAATPLDWAHLIAYAPLLWLPLREESGLNEDEDFYDEDEVPPSQELERYKELVGNAHGEVPPFAELLGRASTLNEAFVSWVDGVNTR